MDVLGDETHSYITVTVFPCMIKWQCWISSAWLEDWAWASNPELHWSQTQFALCLSIVAKQDQDGNGINMKWFAGSNSYSMKSMISNDINGISCLLRLDEEWCRPPKPLLWHLLFCSFPKLEVIGEARNNIWKLHTQCQWKLHNIPSCSGQKSEKMGGAGPKEIAISQQLMCQAELAWSVWKESNLGVLRHVFTPRHS